jgi:lysozyme
MSKISRRVLLSWGLSGTTTLKWASESSAASDPEERWTSLTEQPSRHELYSNYVIPAGLVEQQDSSEAAKPLAIPDVFYFPTDAVTDNLQKKPRVNSIFGVDISHHISDEIQLHLLRVQGIKFVYMKATQGSKFKDGKFSKFWKTTGSLPENAAVDRGAYHFISSNINGKKQADSFVDYLELHGGLQKGDLPPAVDLEWDVTKGNPDGWRGRGATYILDLTLECLLRVKERTQRTPLLYTAKSWFGPDTIPLEKFEMLSEYPLWIADYNPKRKLEEKPVTPNGAPAVLWQFSDKASLATGYRRGLDASIFYGTDTDYQKAFELH